MASAQVVITDANEGTPAVGGIFEGINFFLVQRLPSRSSFVQKIQANGGRVVKQEAQADHIIADHFRKDCPAGSLSYTFVDDAIKHGALPDPTSHTAGPAEATIREAGSAVPGKSTRTPFTAEDDRVLWQWVERAKTQGALIKGNEIYKQLEAKNPRHTYQAWRDRYIKKLIDRPPAGVEVTVAANAPPTPPTAQDAQADISAAITAATQGNTGDQRPRPTAPEQHEETQKGEEEDETAEHEPDEDEEESEESSDSTSGEESEFTQEEHDELMDMAEDIENIAPDREDQAWRKWHRLKPQHSAQAWHNYYHEHIRPLYLKRKAEERRAQKAKQRAMSQEDVTDAANENHVQRNEAGEMDGRQRKTAASPARPGSSGSQKRKRSTEASLSQDPNDRKRPRSVQKDTLHVHQQTEKPTQSPRPSGALSTQPIEILSSDDEQHENEPETAPTSELNRDAALQLEAEQLADDEDILPTSELDRQVQAQIRNETIMTMDPQTDVDDMSMNNLPTSAPNHVVDQEIRNEAYEQEVEMVDEEASLAQMPESISSQAYDTAPSHIHKPSQMGTFEANRNPLTEANLASQQAQHKAELLRGTDLPEDKESGDSKQQDQYAQYLQDIVKASTLPKPDPVRASSPRGGLRSPSVEHPSQIMSLGLDNFELTPIRDLQMSSQQEIEDAFNEAINWPESPKYSQRSDIQSQNVGFETQIAYPKLFSQPPDISQEADEQLSFGKSPVASEITYPALPRQPQEAPVVPLADSQNASFSNEQARRSESPSFERESSYVRLNEEREVNAPMDEPAEHDVDLSIPEPEGGWNESASPIKGAIPGPHHEEAGRRADVEVFELLEHDKYTAQVVNVEQGADGEEIVEAVSVEQRVVDVSSDSSSSTSESIEDDDAASQEALERRALETQDIVNAETQLPDLEVPFPPDSDEESLVDPPAPLSSQPRLVSPNKNWSKHEDKLLLQGMRQGLTAAQIVGTYGFERTPSAVRNRRATLLKQTPEGEVSNLKRKHESNKSKTSSVDQDKLLHRGMRQGMGVTQTVEEYLVERSPSAVSNRPAGLLKQLPDDKIPNTSEEFESSDSDVDELSFSPAKRPLSPMDYPSLFVEQSLSPLGRDLSPIAQSSSSSESSSSPLKMATSESQRNLPLIQKLPDEDIDSYVDKMVVYGYKEGSIINALKCTSMRPDLADLVLLEEKAGKGLPADIAGVWSEEEDRTLESGNARGLRKLEEKHTWKECEERMQFLQDWRDEDKEE